MSTGEGNVAGVLEVPLGSISDAISELTLANCTAVFGNPAMLCLTHWDTDAMVVLFTAFNNSFAGLSGCEMFADVGDQGLAGGGGDVGVEGSAESVGQSGQVISTFMDEAGQACKFSSPFRSRTNIRPSSSQAWKSSPRPRLSLARTPPTAAASAPRAPH